MINRNKLIFSLILLLYFLVRIPGIGYDLSNTDAYRWHKRSETFLHALKSGNLQETYQHYQPGVTIMWLNSLVKQASFSFQYHVQKNQDPFTLENADWYPVIHGISKAEVIFVLAFLLFWQIVILSKLFDEKIAFTFGFFMSLEPYLVGIDRWFHLSSLEMYFAFTSLLLLLYWYQNSKDKFLFLSGVLFSFSVLSKVTTLLILPVFIFLIFHKSLQNEGSVIRTFVSKALLFTFSSMIALFIFFPALAVNTVDTFEKIFSSVAMVAAKQDTYPLLTKFNKLIFYDLVILYKLSPITLVLFILGLLNVRKLVNKFSLFIILLTFLEYYLFFSIFQKKIDRYVIAMFPYIVLVASYSLYLLKDKIKYVLISLSIIYFVIVSYIYYPVYSAYYSPYFGGTKKAIQLGIYDNSGEYYSDAAYYLNSKGRDIQVFVPNSMASFFYYFKGETTYQLDENVDYVVTSFSETRNEIDNFGCNAFEKSFGSREYDVVFVWKCK